jgi:preprotein translocase subunit SecA
VLKAKGLEPKAPVDTGLTYSAPTETGEVEVQRGPDAGSEDPYAKVGRNELCPCGSGKKFKRCHGASGGPTGTTARVS